MNVNYPNARSPRPHKHLARVTTLMNFRAKQRPLLTEAQLSGLVRFHKLEAAVEYILSAII